MLSRRIDYTNSRPSYYVPTHSSGWILECRRKLDTLVQRPLHLACNATLTEVETVVFFCRAHARNIPTCTIRLQFGAFGPQRRKKTPKGVAEHPSVFPIRHQRWRGARSIFLASVAHQLTQTCSVTLSWSRISLSLWFRRWLCRWVDKHPTGSLRPHMHLIGLYGPRIIRSAPWLVMEEPNPCLMS